MLENIINEIGKDIIVKCIKEISSIEHVRNPRFAKNPLDFCVGNLYEAKITRPNKTVWISAKSENPITHILYRSEIDGSVCEEDANFFNEHFEII